MSHLNEDGEEDDSDDGRQEHVSHGEVAFVQQKSQRESDCPTQAAVRYNKLVLGGQFDDAELVNYGGQPNDTWKKKTLQ